MLAVACISIHAPREGSDRQQHLVRPQRFIFLSTLPARGATSFPDFVQPIFGISIHAPREGSDGLAGGGVAEIVVISIHAPREGSDGMFGFK